ncbi:MULTISPECIES: GNAT family N-acetyltransferase [Haloarcula]|uniref:GNAT family N-acetyltransferase n=1 Tax=Haloarcula TaxID=2237 RepID=UPI0023EC0371|nr:GNAT family N-acetyltransferase [Halomicroarcula sp. XH51]
MVTLGDGVILVDGDEVGKFTREENHLKKIEVIPEERNQGYATEALRQYLDIVESRGFDRVTTTPATTPVIRHVFSKLGFRKVENPGIHDFIDGAPEEMYQSCFLKEF